MKKVVVLAVSALVLAVAAVAYAQERTNAYTVRGNVSPSTAGTTKKPVPVSVEFNYTVGEQSQPPLRPSPVQRYTIGFSGLRVNSNSFPGCTAAQINRAESTRGCPSGSRIGTGKIDAVAGGESDRTNTSIKCPLNLEVYNSRRNKAAIYVVGGPDAPAGKKTACPTTTNAALDASFIRRGTTTSLQFNVPLVPFRQQLGTIEVAVIRVQSNIPRKTRRVNGRTVGFFEAIGGCRNRKRTITVTFLNEDGKTARAQDATACR